MSREIVEKADGIGNRKVAWEQSNLGNAIE